MNEQKNNGRGIFYGVIGVATLVVAIIGATFAYFTASASNANTITGNMASIKLGLAVRKVTNADVDNGGMIPMSNSMVEAAVNDTENAVCTDDNGNAVCQVYEITLTNDSTVGQFVDGYVALKGGSGTPTDLPTGVSYVSGASVKLGETDPERNTTMRWAQVFPQGTGDVTATTKYSTAGTMKLQSVATAITFNALNPGTLGASPSQEEIKANAFNHANIKTSATEKIDASSTETDAPKVVNTEYEIFGNKYDAIATNYIRISNHNWGGAEATTQSYDRTADITSALVFNQNIPAKTTDGTTPNVIKYYVVVWLSETGTNQTAGQTDEASALITPNAENFFAGDVTFISAQGSEVSATFGGYTRVPSQSTQTVTP